jgi:hypothetical protein
LDQFIHTPTKIRNPYILALQKNYYNVLSPEPLNMAETTDANNMDCLGSHSTSPARSITSTTVVTVEHSLAAISEVIREMEVDEPPTQPDLAFEPPKIVSTKSSSYSHRFAMYRKNVGTHVQGNPTHQLALFKSFA